MRVRELIKKLEKCNMDSAIVCVDSIAYVPDKGDYAWLDIDVVDDAHKGLREQDSLVIIGHTGNLIREDN